jgi:hypothetical protein
MLVLKCALLENRGRGGGGGAGGSGDGCAYVSVWLRVRTPQRTLDIPEITKIQPITVEG